MGIAFHCPNCNALLDSPEEYAGGSAKCAKCGTAVRIPEPARPPAADSATTAGAQDRRFVLGVTAIATVVFVMAAGAILLKRRATLRERRANIAAVSEDLNARIPEVTAHIASCEFDRAEALLHAIEKSVEDAGDGTLTERYQEIESRLYMAKRDHERKVRDGWSYFEGRFISPEEKRQILTATRREKERREAQARRIAERKRRQEAERLRQEEQKRKEEEARRLAEERRRKESVDTEGDDQPRALGYVVFKDKTYDVGIIKVEVDLRVVISGVPTEDSLRSLLLGLYEEVKKRGPFSYYQHPNKIYIAAFIDKERAASGPLMAIARLDKEFDEDTPTIQVSEVQLRERETGPSVRFGLTEKDRRSVYQQVILAEVRAMMDADKRYPLDLWGGKERIRKNTEQRIKMTRHLTAKYKKRIARKYNVTLEQLQEIGTEGILKQWPYPVLPEEPLGDPQALVVGKTYRLTKETPLMPHYDPVDPLAAIAAAKVIEEGGTIKVLAEANKGGIAWYKVEARQRRGTVVGVGWVNSLALLGQELRRLGR